MPVAAVVPTTITSELRSSATSSSTSTAEPGHVSPCTRTPAPESFLVRSDKPARATASLSPASTIGTAGTSTPTNGPATCVECIKLTSAFSNGAATRTANSAARSASAEKSAPTSKFLKDTGRTASDGCTTNVGVVANFNVESATEPMKIRLSIFLPRLPMTNKSDPDSRALFATTSAVAPLSN